jgi:hypothetical protein
LNEQLLEHVALFHLFGDPLLKLPIPKRIELTAQVGSTLTVSGTTDGDGTVLLELVLPSNRLSLNDPQRTECRFDEATRTAYQEKYRQSNNRVIVSKTVPVDGGVFQTELAIPDGLHGEYVVRAFRVGKTDYSLGSKAVMLQRRIPVK